MYEKFDPLCCLLKKFKDYIIFKRAFEIVKNRNHLTMDGLRQIVALKAKLNTGLSDNR